MKRDNPFTLTFGRQPMQYITRYENTNEIISTFTAQNFVSQTYLISGVRGSGKTVLMTSVAKELAETGEWIIVNLNSTQDLLSELESRLSNEIKSMSAIAGAELDLNIFGVGLGLKGNANNANTVSAIEALLKSIKKKEKRVLITIDEVTNSNNMRSFASQFQIFLREDYPIYLIMTGLYENIYAIQNDPQLTFLLRSPKIFLSPLSINQISVQYRDIFNIDIEKAKKLACITKGYAFAFQALGLLYWEYRETLTLDEILEKLDAMLDDFVYKKIWDNLSQQDKNVLGVLINNGKTKTADICKETGIKQNSFSKYRERLINRGLIVSSGHGYVELALPRFAEVAQIYMIE